MRERLHCGRWGGPVRRLTVADDVSPLVASHRDVTGCPPQQLAVFVEHGLQLHPSLGDEGQNFCGGHLMFMCHLITPVLATGGGDDDPPSRSSLLGAG